VGRGHAENESAGRLDDDLREAFLRLGELCRKSGTRGFLLRYDEFHVIRERRGQLTLSALLAATSAAQQKSVPMMLVLCGLPPLLENLVRAKSYSERMFFPEQLGRLEPPEDRAALIDPAVRLGRRFEDEVVDAVMADTEAYPFFIQIFGDGLWSGTEAPVIRWPDYERLRPKILDVLDRSFFEARFLKASPEERKLLRSVAEHGESAATRDLGGRWPNSELQKHLARLTEKGLVFRPQRGFVAFTAPMFGAFLRRRAQ